MDIEKYVASDLLNKFEFYNYGHALEILHHAFPKEWSELQERSEEHTSELQSLYRI